MIWPSGTQQALLVRAGAHFCAIPLEHVVETMRPLPLEAVGDMPAFVLGVSVIRGEPVPVVDPRSLFALGQGATPSRLVLLRTGERRVAMAVEGVVGVLPLEGASLGELPPLLRDGVADALSAIGTLDAALLLVLRAMQLVPEALWRELDARRGKAASG